jgi:hypothetical protein
MSGLVRCDEVGLLFFKTAGWGRVSWGLVRCAFFFQTYKVL